MVLPLKSLITVCLGFLLFTNAACEDKNAKEALATCKTDLGNEQKLVASQSLTIDELKSHLSEAQAKAEETGKQSDMAKGAKNANTGEAKKSEPATKKASKK